MRCRAASMDRARTPGGPPPPRQRSTRASNDDELPLASWLGLDVPLLGVPRIARRNVPHPFAEGKRIGRVVEVEDNETLGDMAHELAGDCRACWSRDRDAELIEQCIELGVAVPGAVLTREAILWGRNLPAVYS